MALSGMWQTLHTLLHRQSPRWQDFDGSRSPRPSSRDRAARRPRSPRPVPGDTPVNSNRILRLKKLLLAHLERLQNNMIALERDINKAAGRHAIHRRKLKDFLRTSKDVSLRLSELEAFDDYLSEHGEGLAFVPIFERPALLPTLAAQKVVHFLVGARSIKKILNVSHLDTDAFGAIGQALNNPRPVASVLEVVLLDAPQRERDLLIERTLQAAEGVVVIGSPVSNPAAERMLQLMTGYRASKFGGATRPPL